MTNPEMPHYSAAPAYPPRQNVLAIISLVSAFFVPLAAIVTGHIALSQLAHSSEEGYGLAKAGLILGYVFAGAQLFFVMIWLIVVLGVVGGVAYRG